MDVDGWLEYWRGLWSFIFGRQKRVLVAAMTELFHVAFWRVRWCDDTCELFKKKIWQLYSIQNVGGQICEFHFVQRKDPPVNSWVTLDSHTILGYLVTKSQLVWQITRHQAEHPRQPIKFLVTFHDHPQVSAGFAHTACVTDSLVPSWIKSDLWWIYLHMKMRKFWSPELVPLMTPHFNSI